MRRWRGLVQLLVFVVVMAAVVVGLQSASATPAPQGGPGVLGPSGSDKKPSPSPTPEPSSSPTPEPSSSPTPEPDPDPSPEPTPPPSQDTRNPPSPVPTSPSDPAAGSVVVSGGTTRGGQEPFADRPIPEAPARERNPERVPDDERFANDSLVIDALDEILDDLLNVQDEPPIATLDTPCTGVKCEGATRGIDVAVVIASGCVVASVIMGLAISAAKRRRQLWLYTHAE